jgi:hypothetical protein
MESGRVRAALQGERDRETREALRAIRSHAGNILLNPRDADGHCEHAQEIRKLANAALRGEG